MNQLVNTCQVYSTPLPLKCGLSESPGTDNCRLLGRQWATCGTYDYLSAICGSMHEISTSEKFMISSLGDMKATIPCIRTTAQSRGITIIPLGGVNPKNPSTDRGLGEQPLGLGYQWMFSHVFLLGVFEC